MPALNFKRQFVPHIQARTKNHTIRADRAQPIKVGDKLWLYCGMRTKNCFRILPEPVTCTKVERIRINYYAVFIEERILAHDECERLAQADGFSNFTEMMAFWDGRFPFSGQIIHWK